MSLAVIVGTYGTGKTLLATKAALDTDRLVAANYKIDCKNYKKLLFHELPELDEKCVAILDEAYIYVDARKSMSLTNQVVTYVLAQSRKMGLDFILTLQLNSMLDLRFRDLADVYITSDLVNAEYDDNDELIAGAFIYKFYFKGEYKKTYAMTFDYAKQHIFGKYSTLERIDTGRDFSKELMIVEPESEEKAISDIIDEMTDRLPMEAWTKPMIKDLVFELRYPYTYTDKVHGRVKRLIAEEKYRNAGNVKTVNKRKSSTNKVQQ